MNNYKFYTPIEVAEKLLGLIPERSYNNIVDICCGSWNLLKAAKTRFPYAKFTGVDIDENSARNRFEYADFYMQDGRDFALQSYKNNETYDLILSNPPFGYLDDENRKFVGCKEDCFISCLNDNRYEHEMIQANLMLVENKGILVFILPVTFVEGEKNKKLRSNIAKKYWVRDLVKLPLDTFASKQIYTWAVVMQQIEKESYFTNYYEMSFDGQKYDIKQKGTYTYDCILKGNWTGNQKRENNNIKVKSFRGCISSNQLSCTGEKVFHCSSAIIDNKWYPSQRYCDKVDLLSKSKKVLPGDIIVNRIGKCAGYWYFNTEETYISDCLIVFRAESQEELTECFKKNSTKGKLNIPLKGVSTRYITVSDVEMLL